MKIWRRILPESKCIFGVYLLDSIMTATLLSLGLMIEVNPILGTYYAWGGVLALIAAKTIITFFSWGAFELARYAKPINEKKHRAILRIALIAYLIVLIPGTLLVNLYPPSLN